MAKRRASDQDVRRFIEAVYPAAPDLAIASFDEATCLRDAAERIAALEAALREMIPFVRFAERPALLAQLRELLEAPQPAAARGLKYEDMGFPKNLDLLEQTINEAIKRNRGEQPPPPPRERSAAECAAMVVDLIDDLKAARATSRLLTIEGVIQTLDALAAAMRRPGEGEDGPRP